MNKKLAKISFILGVVLLASSAYSVNATTCNFTRDLEEGSMGEDVRCLQQYLNTSGHIVSNSGVGSPGQETNTFRSLTKGAVMNWQLTNGVFPVTGYFGPKSRARYIDLINSGGSSPSTGTSIAELNNKIISLQIELAAA